LVGVTQDEIGDFDDPRHVQESSLCA